MSDRKYITEAFVKVRLVFSHGTDNTVDVGDYIRRHPHPQYHKPILVNRIYDRKVFASSIMKLPISNNSKELL